MKARIARFWVIFAEAVGVLAAAIFAFAGLLAWRLQAAPVDLSWAAPAVRAAANFAMADALVRDVSEVRISKASRKGDYLIILKGISLGGAAGDTGAEIPNVELEVRPADLVAGKLGPRKILAEGARLRILRRTDRKVKLDFGTPTNKKGRVFQALTGGAYFRQAFEMAALKDVSIVFADESSGRTWTGKNGNATITRSEHGYVAAAQSGFQIGAHEASMSISVDYDIGSDVVASNLSLNSAPVGDLIAVFFNENAELFTSPVSGDAFVNFNTEGQVLSSKIDLKAGEGVLTIGGWSAPISNFEAVAGFDPVENRFSIERFAWNGGVGDGELNGAVTLERSADEGEGVSRVAFAIESGIVNVNQSDLFESPWVIDRAAVSGFYDVADKATQFDKTAADFHGLSLTGSGSFKRKPSGAASIAANLNIDGATDVESLLRFWPKKLANSAREFVDGRMLAGRIGSAEVVVDLETDSIGEDGVVPDDALTLKFRADEAKVIYAPGMTPLTKVGGVGVLKGNSFRFDAEKAMAGPVRLTRGEVDIPILAPKGAPAYFRFSAAGDAGDILSIIDQEPLSVLKDSSFEPHQFSGPVTATIELMRPNLKIAPPESYRYSGIAAFSKLQIEDIIGDAPLTDGAGRLDLKTEGMTIIGDAQFGNAPVRIEWKQRFFGGGDKAAIKVEGIANSSTADLLGIPTRQVVQGDVPFTAKAIGGVDAFKSLSVEADLTGAVLVSELLGWMKPAGTKARGTAVIAFDKSGTDNEIAIAGEGFEIAGKGRLTRTGAVEYFDFPTFRLGEAADFAMTGERNTAGVLAVTLDGARLNAAEMARQLTEGGVAGGSKTPFALSARLGRVDLRGGVAYHDATLEFARNADHIDMLRFLAASGNGKPLAIELTPAGGDTKEQSIAATADDIGSMLAGVFGLSSVRGGVGRLDFTFTPGDEEAPRVGALEAHDMRLVNAPLLAKVFAAGSLTGLVDLMNGDGIELKNAMARFSITDGEVRIEKARATGPSVGITAQGAFGLEGDRAVTLNGAVAPAYGVNSFLGKTPVIGDIFVNRKGEGLLALSYDVSGSAIEPRVTVNPLSAFTPGVFRRMFEGRVEEGAEADEVSGAEAQ